MFAAEAPSPIDGLASAATIILIIEVLLIVLLLATLAVLLAVLTRWIYQHAVPPVHQVVPRVKGALDATDRATGRVVDIVAALYSRRRGIEVAVNSIVDNIFPPEDLSNGETETNREDLESEETAGS
ncbi:MAG TPA: hypothetical protein VKB76_01960 [Ktedonobacterales bacterium]|nr:hypothetical protein [Ktedonobacterales bacterium]